MTSEAAQPWKLLSTAGSAWDRQLSRELYEFEKARVDEISHWVVALQKSAGASAKTPCRFFVARSEVPPRWKRAAVEAGAAHICGLLALPYSDVHGQVAVIPAGVKIPRPTDFIEITSARRVRLISARPNLRYDVQEAVWIEAWQHAQPESVYIQGPPRPELKEQVREQIGVSGALLDALVAPLASAPPSMGRPGGIAVGSVGGDSAYAGGFVGQYTQLIPPMFRTVPLPKKAVEGAWYQLPSGMKIHLQEHFSIRLPTVDAALTESRRRYRQIIARRTNRSESSVCATMVSPTGDPVESWQTALENIERTHIVIPENLEEIMSVAPAPTSPRQLEQVWSEVVKSRVISPAAPFAPKEIAARQAGVRDDLEALLSGILPDEWLKPTARRLSAPISENLMDVVLSTARAEGRTQVLPQHVDAAHRRMFHGMGRALLHADFHGIVLGLERELRNKKVRAITEVLAKEQQWSLTEIWSELSQGDDIRDIDELIGVLDRLRRDGFIAEVSGIYILVTPLF